MLPLISFTTSYYTFRCADQGLAHALGLPTLRHGTNVVSWLGIHILGARPEMGGSHFGINAIFQKLDQAIETDDEFKKKPKPFLKN